MGRGEVSEAPPRDDGHALNVEGMTKTFGSTRALSNASLTVTRGTIHALLGGNGSGKSTLIKALAGVQPADAGTISVNGQQFDAASHSPAHAWAAGLRFVHQQSSTFPDLSIAENLALGYGYETGTAGRIRWRQMRRRSASVMSRFGIEADPETLVGELGPAMQTMTAIARALQDQENEDEGVLVLDEPTASLPPAEANLLLEAVKRYAESGKTIVLVTHRLDEVLKTANEVTVLRDGRVTARLSRSRMSHESLVVSIMGGSVEPMDYTSVKGVEAEIVFRAEPPSGATVEVGAGEVVGVAGLLGSGRTALLRHFFGAGNSPASVEIDGRRMILRRPRDAMRAGVAYVPEDRAEDASFAELGVKENISITALGQYWSGRFRAGRERRAARSLMDSLSIKAASEEAPLGSLSGGNQQKVILARWLQRRPRLLLLDEPTQGVDVGARLEIHRAIRDLTSTGAGALVATSDDPELVSLCDRAILVRHGSIVGEISNAELTEETLSRAVHDGAERASV